MFSTGAHMPISMLAPLSLQPDVVSITEWESFPNLGWRLKKLVAELETGLEPGPSIFDRPPFSSFYPFALLYPNQLYLHICGGGEGKEAVSLAEFAAVIEWLESNGGHPYLLTARNAQPGRGPAGPRRSRRSRRCRDCRRL